MTGSMSGIVESGTSKHFQSNASFLSYNNYSVLKPAKTLSENKGTGLSNQTFRNNQKHYQRSVNLYSS